MTRPGADEVELRRGTEQDYPPVLDLLRRTLGWSDSGHETDFFWWKHRENPFGPSPHWVALHDDQVVGYRTFLRWEFLSHEGTPTRAVRAVDTVTHPDYRGIGLFRSLTLQAVSELTATRDAFVFNTPNDQSRPGYLRMGWASVGRLPVGVLPAPRRRSLGMLSARTPADLWSQETTVGVSARDALADDRTVAGLVQHAPSSGTRTRRDAAYWRWRTAFPPLHYRLLLASSDPAEGGVIFRLRRRGGLLEAAVIEQLVPTARVGRRVVRRILAETGADYAIGLRGGPGAGLIPVPRQGPLLTTRPLAGPVPSPNDWNLSLGDIELF